MITALWLRLMARLFGPRVEPIALSIGTGPWLGPPRGGSVRAELQEPPTKLLYDLAASAAQAEEFELAASLLIEASRRHDGH